MEYLVEAENSRQRIRFLERIYYSSDAVGDASADKQEERQGWHIVPEDIHRDYGHPAHQQIEDGGDDAGGLHIKDFEE